MGLELKEFLDSPPLILPNSSSLLPFIIYQLFVLVLLVLTLKWPLGANLVFLLNCMYECGFFESVWWIIDSKTLKNAESLTSIDWIQTMAGRI